MTEPKLPWPAVPPDAEHFRQPPRAYGILPFWFLNGELDPEEMRLQLREFRAKGMPGIILHGRYGLEMPYLSETYLNRIKLAVEEAEMLGLKTWIYDEMNWPSGTADGRVLRERPDLSQRYIECINFTVRGPWFTYLTGADSRYLDFERSTPVAAFAVGSDGRVIDLTPNLSFVDVIPWEAPAGTWHLMYIVEKEAEYYIDALNPEATAEFLRIGYEPYARVVDDKMPAEMLGFYTDEPAMHYYLTGGDNPIVPWTKDMFRRFQERNGYNLRPRLPDLFFDVSRESAQVRYDFYSTLTEFYSDAYYRQIHAWCREHNVLFTGHLLYEEWLRKMIRVEGNLFKHYTHMDVVGVDHLYPFIGNRDRPDEHVAMKVASSAAHQLGSERLLCESFGGIFMDATMQRMKWVADWEYVLGVNLLNPHGFHYTLEGPRKRDWPPSMFYQYPWWHYYGDFSNYISRLSHMLTGGRHVAKVAMLWPINAMFATYTPQSHNPFGDRTEGDFNALTDLLLRLHYDFDYLDEDMLAGAELQTHDGRAAIRLRDEDYELLILPPMTHLKLSSVERLEAFVQAGGRVLGTIFLPDRAFGPDGLVDISDRIRSLFDVDPAQSQERFRTFTGIETITREHPGGGKTAFVQSYALLRQIPMRLQQQLGTPGRPESPAFVVDADGDNVRYWFARSADEREEITSEVVAERAEVATALKEILKALITADVTIDNPEIFYLHRVKDGADLYFLVNPTFRAQAAEVMLTGLGQPMLWDPSTGDERPLAPSHMVDGNTCFRLELPPAGSAFIRTLTPTNGGVGWRIVDTNVIVDHISEDEIGGYARVDTGYVVLDGNGQQDRLTVEATELPAPLLLDGDWEWTAEDANAYIAREWIATTHVPGTPEQPYTAPDADTTGWLPMVPGAWSYQLPTEPAQPYPIDVWYRISFDAAYVPATANLIVDGFAGSSWKLFVNGQVVEATPVRSAFDSEMQAIDIAGLMRAGTNVVALCLTVTRATDGLLDLLKITGDFALRKEAGRSYTIVEPGKVLAPAPWTEQGYPYYSGRGRYRRTISLPVEAAGRRVFLDPTMGDDVLEVLVNGRQAGVRLWAPYTVEITELLQPGENVIELRVANTLVNLLEATARPSGLAGAPRLVTYQPFIFAVPVQGIKG
ncbi:MAG TPA: glycosyl hydrolase [Herpetosiphonaceae bacterium]|nr:glycosyl hydrolase [Herpetosiphonaceae bacterium]